MKDENRTPIPAFPQIKERICPKGMLREGKGHRSLAGTEFFAVCLHYVEATSGIGSMSTQLIQKYYT